MAWTCSFCKKKEENGMTHSTCIIPNEHYYFCHSCFMQWEGIKKMTNINLLKLKKREHDADISVRM